MSKIIGGTVGTPFKPSSILDKAKAVKTVNGISPDENGNVDVVGQGGGQAGGYYVPAVDENGNISWTPSEEGMPTVETANIKGESGEQGPKGDTGDAGKDGTSVTVSNVSESTADGGSNVITFSDGKTITIKNGSKGSTGSAGEQGPKGDTGDAGSNGKDGTSVSITNVSESTADGGSSIITFSDGNTLTVKNGNKGSDGTNGNGIKSAVLNADYTLTLTFDNGTSYTTPSIRGATGATGETGANGSNGKDGTDGKDGTSITITNVSESTADGGSNVVTFSDGKTVTIKNGSKGSTGATGSNGKDGTSATHSWDGTTLTVTSASGTSSADLKGDKGDKGDQGIQATRAILAQLVLPALTQPSQVHLPQWMRM